MHWHWCLYLLSSFCGLFEFCNFIKLGFQFTGQPDRLFKIEFINPTPKTLTRLQLVMLLWTWFENKKVGYFRENLNVAVYFHYSTISKVQVWGDLLKARFTSYMLLKLQAKCIVRRCLKNGRTDNRNVFWRGGKI